MFNGVCACESKKWYGAGEGANAFVSVTGRRSDYDHFPSITLYKKRGGELRKKNREKGRRRKDLNCKNGTCLRASKANHIFSHFIFRLFKITVTYISHAIPLTQLLILSWHVFYTVETEISACMAYIYYSDP